jgi:hypothetical protein
MGGNEKPPALKKAEDGADWFWLIRYQFIIPFYCGIW